MLPSTYAANCNHLECDAELKQVEREKVRKALRPFLQLRGGCNVYLPYGKQRTYSIMEKRGGKLLAHKILFIWED